MNYAEYCREIDKLHAKRLLAEAEKVRDELCGIPPLALRDYATLVKHARERDSLRCRPGQKAWGDLWDDLWDDLWNEAWKRRVDEMMLAPPPAIYVSKPMRCLGVDVAAKTEDRGPISDADHMGILALDLKQALCPKPEPQEVQPPKRAPRVHGIGTVAAMGHRMGTGFGGDPDL
jgi:hypothetical protein